MVGRVIGKNGETIRALQNYSGAQIQIDQTTDPMKVTVTGVQQSLNLAISMVTDIVNGNFKGFAMLRQYANDQKKLEAIQPIYAPGYGLIPPSQMHSTSSDTSRDATEKLTPAAPGSWSPTSSYILSLARARLPGMGLTTTGGSHTPQGRTPLRGLDSIGDIFKGIESVVSPVKDSAPEPSSCFAFSEVRGCGGGGSLSPDLSCGWSSSTLLGELSTGFDSVSVGNDTKLASCRSPYFDQDASQLHRLSDYVNGHGSFSDGSESATATAAAAAAAAAVVVAAEEKRRKRMMIGSGQPSDVKNENVVYLVDPNGRPFSLNLGTGQTQWLKYNF
eukprot:g7597.t1